MVHLEGDCDFYYDKDGKKYYVKVTVTVPADEHAFGRLGAIGSIFTLAAMMASM